MTLRCIRAWLGGSAIVAGQALAAPLGIVTIVDGDAVLVREARRFAVVEGLRLRSDDMVHTAASGALVRVEFTDGAVLDLGPDTRALLSAQGPKLAYLAQGWAKLATAKSGAQALGSPRLDTVAAEGTVLMRVGPAGTPGALFVEAGQASMVDRRDGQPGQPQALRDGQGVVLQAAAPARVAAGLPAQLRDQLPRGLADALPRRARLFQAKAVEPGIGSPIAYADVATWLNAEAAVRQPMLARFRGLAQDRAFRAGLLADLKLHPEWDRVLHPERYRPRPTPPVAVRPELKPAAPRLAEVVAADPQR